MTFDHSVLTNCSPVSDSTYIYTANGSPLVVTHSGNITPTYSPLLDKLTLPSVFCIPKLTMKLLSVGKLTDYDSNVLFTLTSSIVQDHTGRTIGTGRKVNGLYQLESLHLSSSPHLAASFSVTFDIWHRQLGHLSTSRLKTLSDSCWKNFSLLAQIIVKVVVLQNKLMYLLVLAITWLQKYLI